MSDEPVFQVNGQDHFGPYLGRVTYNDVGRVVLEVIDDDDSVLLKEGDEFATFFAGRPLRRRE